MATLIRPERRRLNTADNRELHGDDARGLHLRRGAHADRPLRRRARQGAHRRSRARSPIKALVARNPQVDWTQLDEVFLGCANQAGEDNRNVARMALLLAGLPDTVPGITVNRLCASGLEAVGIAARAIKAGEMDFAIAGGVESMTRAPFVMGKAHEAFSAQRRNLRHHHRLALHQSADEGSNTASIRCRRPARTSPRNFQVARKDQDAFALRSQQRAGKAARPRDISPRRSCRSSAGRQGRPIVVDQGRASAPDTTLEALAKLKPFCAIRARSRPATHPASMTAPRR